MNKIAFCLSGVLILLSFAALLVTRIVDAVAPSHLDTLSGQYIISFFQADMLAYVGLAVGTVLCFFFYRIHFYFKRHNR